MNWTYSKSLVARINLNQRKLLALKEMYPKVHRKKKNSLQSIRFGLGARELCVSPVKYWLAAHIIIVLLTPATVMAASSTQLKLYIVPLVCSLSLTETGSNQLLYISPQDCLEPDVTDQINTLLKEVPDTELAQRASQDQAPATGLSPISLPTNEGFEPEIIRPATAIVVLSTIGGLLIFEYLTQFGLISKLLSLIKRLFRLS